jgi:hypothetical protein
LPPHAVGDPRVAEHGDVQKEHGKEAGLNACGAHACVAHGPQNQDSGANQDGVINGWDLMYYHTILLDTEYKLDEDKIKEYFPLDKVTDGMFEIYQQLLGLRFEKVRRPAVADRKKFLAVVCWQFVQTTTLDKKTLYSGGSGIVFFLPNALS